MSKGSTARPFSVPKDEYNNRFDAIFGKKKTPQEPEKPGEKDTSSPSTSEQIK
jgi:hypothetical protein